MKHALMQPGGAGCLVRYARTWELPGKGLLRPSGPRMVGPRLATRTGQRTERISRYNAVSDAPRL